MTAAQLARLRAEIRSDRHAIEAWMDELEGLELVDGSRAVLAQAAWALHHAYSGIEAILERVMRVVEGSVPEGPDSHKALIDVAALDIEGIRPALLSAAVVAPLHELRAFRHFVRHAYAVALDAARLASLLQLVADLRSDLEEDLDRLDQWLAAVARELR